MMAMSDFKFAWAAWLLTFAMHSTLLLGLAWLMARYARSHRLKELLWKTALVGGIFMATLQAWHKAFGRAI